jgi:hypothetical protein
VEASPINKKFGIGHLARNTTQVIGHTTLQISIISTRMMTMTMTTTRSRLLVLLSLCSLISSGHAAAAAGFFVQGSSLTWNVPQKNQASRTRRISKPKAKKAEANVYSILSKLTVVDPHTGKDCQALDDALLNSQIGPRNPFSFLQQNTPKPKALVVVMPQLGDFDSCEYAELLKNVLPDLERANIALRIIGIGNCKTAHMFSLFTGIPLECIRVDPTASVHSELGLHRGPNWDVPDWIPPGVVEWFARDVCGNDNTKRGPTQIARSWLNYMAMCAGISAPGTLKEILRGYLGDKTAPERLPPGETVRAGPITIKGITDVKIGPIQYQSLWKNEQGYLRPAELATIRLRSMVEVLTKFDHYVPDQRLLDWRGGTFLLDETSSKNIFGGSTNKNKPLYEYRDRGVLSYSETMDRPLSFLSDLIGMERARNPMGMNDPEFVYEYE